MIHVPKEIIFLLQKGKGGKKKRLETYNHKNNTIMSTLYSFIVKKIEYIILF